MSAATPRPISSRERRTRALLQEVPLDAKRSARSVPFSGTRGRALAAFAAISLLAALAVFFFLFGRDRLLLRFNTPEHPINLTRTTPVPSPAQTEPVPTPGRTSVVTPLPNQTFPFQLQRSARFRQTGPARVRVVKLNTRRGWADLVVQIGSRTVRRRRLYLNEPLRFALGRNRDATLTLKSINRNAVSGVVAVQR